ncbi:CBL-interacting serine/threonine-protein kinase 23 [Spatholobus suberectus]|nr:CBL-interacting serine/threonine-protein kinase 23 [Spatholobus suberectus]
MGSRSEHPHDSSNTFRAIRVGKYELGRTLGEGNFSVVKLARHVDTGDNVAIKILDKERVLRNQKMDVMEREILIMKTIRHPNVVHMYEAMAAETKMYIVLELVTGGELFDKITNSGRLTEPEARKYFQQLICAVDYCYSKGLFHRNLKPENLLVDADGVLKVSDFGLSTLPQQVRYDGMLHTTCGSPKYMAPEVISNVEYESAKADLWSCGVILFVLLAGYLPFNDNDITALYVKTLRGDFTCPSFFSPSATRLIKRILHPNPAARITINGIFEDEWFKKDYIPPRISQENISLDKVSSSFSEAIDSQNLVAEGQDAGPAAPVTRNAFDMMCTSLGFNLIGNLFNKVLVKRETSFISKCSANEIISGIEHTAAPLGFNVKKRNYKLRIEGEKAGRKGHLSIATKIFEVDPPFHMVELRKAGGDTLEFDKFYKDLSTGLKHIIWKEDTDGAGGSTSTAK